MMVGSGWYGLRLLFWLLGSLLLALAVVPLAGLLGLQPLSRIVQAAGDADVRSAIGFSLAGAALATLAAGIAGVPLAWLLARSAFPGRSIVSAIVDLPLAVPHTVAGIALLLAFGRRGVLGGPAASLLGLHFWGTLAGVVAAMLFVSFPYTVNAARLGFQAIDPRWEKVARTLGMGSWRILLRITLPLAARGVMTGLTLTFARSLSEFGAVVILAYYPMTAPVRIYELFLTSGLDQAAAAASLLLLVSLAAFGLLRWLDRAVGRAGR